MVLKNKDGSVYRLRGPNLLLKEQNVWTKYTIHNMRWNPVVQEDNIKIEPLNTDFSIKDKFIDELNMTQPPKEEPIIERKPVVIKEKEKIKEKEDDGLKKSFIYCLPSILQKKIDNLYDEEFVTVTYGNPFSFEAVITEEHDLFLNFWTTTEMDKESVIFPKTNHKRWWKIVDKEHKTGGYLYSCYPSSYQPHFENV